MLLINNLKNKQTKHATQYTRSYVFFLYLYVLAGKEEIISQKTEFHHYQHYWGLSSTVSSFGDLLWKARATITVEKTMRTLANIITYREKLSH